MDRAPRYDALYLHARLPSEARIALYAPDGLASIPLSELGLTREDCEICDAELLLPTEESRLTPIFSTQEIPTNERTVPAMWRVPVLALPLDKAFPWLAGLDPSQQGVGLVTLRELARLTLGMIGQDQFAKAEPGAFLQHVPVWSEAAVQALAAVAELVPGSMRTARFALQDSPVVAVTAKHLMLRALSHGLDACTAGKDAPHDRSERIPAAYDQVPPKPVLQIVAPEEELEDGVPWGIHLLFQPVPGMPHHQSLEELQDRLDRDLFPDTFALEALSSVHDKLLEVGDKVPALHRARNMADGRASLNREELDQVLDHLTLLENEGFLVTLPGLESMQRLSAKVRLVEDKETAGGPRPWFDFQWSLAIGENEIDQSDFEKLVDARQPLVFLDRGPILLTPKDREALKAFQKRQEEGEMRVGFFEALRLRLGGATHMHGLAVETIDAGPRLEELVQSLDQTREVEDRPLPEGFVGELRPYQERGQAWMYFLVDQGFGACLADDMGLGKTVQAIAVILDWRINRGGTGPILLVCPVSVLGNWRRELLRFSPELRVELFHGKQRARTLEDFGKMGEENDVVLTSYTLLQRDEELFRSRVWEGVILDEAQNIKNPATRQSKAARELKGNFRLALTGTPLENRPLDLWSIMDFLNEGLLGSRSTFLQTLEHPIIKQRSKSKASTLGRLVRPFVLRRLKTDPDIITDLPEKTEQVVAATLSREQAVLYEAVVRKGMQEVEKANEGMQRRGAILTTLLRLKQVCNHPAHYQSDGSALPNRSGKLDLLSLMLSEALEEGDRCLIFTQFKEMGSLLKSFIEERFGPTALFLHGGVPQREREDMVAKFQACEPDGPRIFVLSLKAGGTGLNLTAANRVFHYDRWWNPAVEDQATDRAFRIGQLRNVFVHKFVCTGTLEERIQQMLERKRNISNTLLGAGENWLTELSNDELRRLLILDRKEALA
ncbi:MAG: SNF2-related protein [Planctomycetota bacterium]